MTATPAPSLAASDLTFKPLSPEQLAWRRLRHHRMAMVSLVILGLLVLYILFGGLLMRGYCAPLGKTVSGEAWANCNDTSLKLQPPSARHPSAPT